MRDGWQQATLNEVCVVDWGNTSLTKAAYTQGGKFLAVSAAGCDGRIDHTEHLRHTPVLSAIGAQCGKMFFPLEDFTAIKNTITLTPKPGKCVGKFLYYLLTFIELPQRGAGQPFISKGDIQKFSVFLPEVVEQERIVAILDEAFEGIDTALKNAEKNLANARELFNSYLNSVFAHQGEGWTEKRLEDTVQSTCSLSYGIVQPGEDVDDGLPIVRPTDLRSKFIRLDGLKRITPALADGYKRTELQGGELLLCVRGGTGSVSIAAGELVGSNVTRGIVPIRFDPWVVIQDFGYFAFISKNIQDQIRAATYGAALMQINICDLRKVSLALPPLDIQERLLSVFNSISAKVERLASIYEQKVASLVELKQTILQKAFAGNLNLQSADAMPEAAE